MKNVDVLSGLGGGFDAQAMLQHAEMRLAYILYCCGLEPESLSSLTIDEIVQAIRISFPKYSDVSQEMQFPKNILIKYSFILVLAARRAWFDRQIALAEILNG